MLGWIISSLVTGFILGAMATMTLTGRILKKRDEDLNKLLDEIYETISGKVDKC